MVSIVYSTRPVGFAHSGRKGRSGLAANAAPYAVQPSTVAPVCHVSPPSFVVRIWYGVG